MSSKKASNSRPNSSSCQDQVSSADRQRRLLQWAWDFLRRSPEYRCAYALWLELPDVLKEDEKLFELQLSGALATFPVEWFDLEPEPLDGDNFGTWYDRGVSLRESLSISIASKFDPGSFMLARWLDPSLTVLPIPEVENFFVPDLELEEARALDRHKVMPTFRNLTKDLADDSDDSDDSDYSGAGEDSVELVDVDFTILANTPITRMFLSGFTEHRWGSLNIRADRSTQMALRFDLALPLKMQLKSAKRQLQIALGDFESTSEAFRLVSFRSKGQPQAWPQMLALLDEREATGSDFDAVQSYLVKLESTHDFTDRTEGLLSSLRRARSIRDGEYKDLIMAAFEIK